ncbi:MAG: nitroreductase family protein [Propionibacteriaceae bacterium]
MELADVLARRRMVRRFDPDVAVPPEIIESLLAAARRTPSAGFTQGVAFLVLDRPEDRDRFWSATAPGAARATSRWLDGMQTAPLLILVWTSEQAYLDRYAEPDKGWTDRDPDRWSAPYWWVDAGMASLALLLSAVDAELGGCFFGVPVDRQDAVRAAFGVPSDRQSVGVVAVGRPVGSSGTPGSPARRPRRPAAELIHRGHWL